MAALDLRFCMLALSSCGARTSLCCGFSYCKTQALGSLALVVVGCGLSSCVTRA